MDTARFQAAVGIWWRLRPGRWYLFVGIPLAVVGAVALLASIVVAPEAVWLERALNMYVPVLLGLIAVSWIEVWLRAWRQADPSTHPS